MRRDWHKAVSARQTQDMFELAARRSWTNRQSIGVLQGPANNDFVKIVDGDFVVGCETFYPAIWNQYGPCYGPCYGKGFKCFAVQTVSGRVLVLHLQVGGH